ncbi:MAG: response regulator transcription factor [Deltaproteobacteria bacterium]|nr:response regulator transcription factor [Deltaproteobacteria bacterium]
MAIKVLLADDHTIVRNGIRLLLEMEDDIRVVGEAGSGREVVAQVRKVCPDVVIMDIEMPELNGIDAIERVLESCPSCAVVVLSMHSTSEHILRALKAGARGYIVKEAAGKELVHSVRTVGLGRRYLCQQIMENLVGTCLDERGPARSEAPVEKLSLREREILQLVVEGKTSAEIAGILYISQKTVETYRSRMMRKLEISDVPNLVKFALRHGLTSLE